MLIDHFSFPTWTQKPKLSTKTTARLEILQQTAENIRSESFPICIVVRKIIISGRKKTPQVIQSDLLIQSDHISQKKDTLNHLAFIFSFFLLGSKRFNHQKIFGGKKKTPHPHTCPGDAPTIVNTMGVAAVKLSPET